MDEYAVHVVFKIEANDMRSADMAIGDVLGTIPDSVIDELTDDPYVLKVEEA